MFGNQLFRCSARLPLWVKGALPQQAQLRSFDDANQRELRSAKSPSSVLITADIGVVAGGGSRLGVVL